MLSVNDAPTATNLTQSLTINEDAPATGLASSIVVSDGDDGVNGYVEQITATLTLNSTASGSLSANDGATYDADTGVWTITGTVAQVNTALANVTFTPAADWNGSATITTHVEDAAHTGPADGAISVAVTPVDDAPAATNLTQSLTINENDSATGLASSIVVSDGDDGVNGYVELITATLILNNTASGSLSANDGASYDADTGVWTITGTVAQVNTALANATFTPAADWGGYTSITTHVEDAAHTGPADGTISVTVIPTNEAPTATNLTQLLTINEDASATGFTSSIVVSDANDGENGYVEQITAKLTLNDTASGSLSSNDGASYDADTGVWTITGTVAQVNTALANVTFTPAADWNGSTAITTHVEDAAHTGPSDGTISVTVNPVNDAPTATNLTQSLTISEGASATGFTSSMVVGDIDDGVNGYAEQITAKLTLSDTASGSLSANDGASYDADTGVWTITGTVAQVNTALANVTFTPAVDWNGSTIITTHVEDAAHTGPSDGSINVTVNPVDDAPTVTNLTQSLTINEDASATGFASSIVVSDVDDGVNGYVELITARLTLSNTASGSLSANDGASYDAGTGVWTITGTVAQVNTALAGVTFTPAADWNGSTTIATHVEDAAHTGPSDGSISVTVNPVNDAPTATNLTQSLTINEGASATGFASSIVVSDADDGVNGYVELITAELTLSNTASGSLSANDGASYDSDTGVWSITGTVAQVNTALANVTFTPAVDWNGSVTVTTHVEDAAHTGPSDGAISVTVTPENDAPAATNLTQSLTINEDASATGFASSIVVSDVDDGVSGYDEHITATLTLSNTASGGLSANDGASYDAGTGVWTITGTVAQVNSALANVRFTPAADWNGSTTITSHVEDAAHTGPSDGAISVTVNLANDAPPATDSSQSLTIDVNGGATNSNIFSTTVNKMAPISLGAIPDSSKVTGLSTGPVQVFFGLRDPWVAKSSADQFHADWVLDTEPHGEQDEGYGGNGASSARFHVGYIPMGLEDFLAWSRERQLGHDLNKGVLVMNQGLIQLAEQFTSAGEWSVPGSGLNADDTESHWLNRGALVFNLDEMRLADMLAASFEESPSSNAHVEPHELAAAGATCSISTPSVLARCCESSGG